MEQNVKVVIVRACARMDDAELSMKCCDIDRAATHVRLGVDDVMLAALAAVGIDERQW